MYFLNTERGLLHFVTNYDDVCILHVTLQPAKVNIRTRRVFSSDLYNTRKNPSGANIYLRQNVFQNLWGHVYPDL